MLNFIKITIVKKERYTVEKYKKEDVLINLNHVISIKPIDENQHEILMSNSVKYITSNFDEKQLNKEGS